MRRAPFPASRPIAVVAPSIQPTWTERDQRRVKDLALLFEAARGALERELGAPFKISPADPGKGSRWLIRVGGTPHPTLTLDRRRQLLISDGPDVDGAFETFSYLRGLVHQEDGTRIIADATTTPEAFDRIRDWIEDSWPSFATKSLSWDRVAARHRTRVLEAPDPVTAIRAWLAELGDAHTTLRPARPVLEFPYVVHLTRERALLHTVPESSEGWRAGARPGMRLEGLDLQRIWSIAGASPHLRPWHAGRVAMREPVEFIVGPRRLRWAESAQVPTFKVTTSRPRAGVGLLRFDAFLPMIEPELDAAIEHLRDCELLVVDLRANGGGNIHMARRFQSRFLRERTNLGTLKTSLPGGGLSAPETLWNEPHAHPWTGRVRFLTSPRTYSAAEDLLLGLQGLPHVAVWGEPSGGGSGRVRTLRTLPGWRLTVSTALTWDRRRRLIEGNGIPVDRHLRTTPGVHALDRLLS